MVHTWFLVNCFGSGQMGGCLLTQCLESGPPKLWNYSGNIVCQLLMRSHDCTNLSRCHSGLQINQQLQLLDDDNYLLVYLTSEVGHNISTVVVFVCRYIGLNVLRNKYCVVVWSTHSKEREVLCHSFVRADDIKVQGLGDRFPKYHQCKTCVMIPQCCLLSHVSMLRQICIESDGGHNHK